MANSTVGYIALLRQLASFCKGWVSDHCRDRSICILAYMDSRGWGAPTPPIYMYTRETAAFGCVSLALRECRLRWNKNLGCLGCPFGEPSAAVKKNIGASQMLLQLPQGHEDSEYVLSFEIGQREGGFYSG